SAVTDAVSDLVRTQHGTGGPLLAREAGTERLGRWSYWLFVWGIVIAGLLVLREFLAAAMLGIGSWREVGHNLAGTIVSSQWLVLIFEVLWRNPWLVAWQVLTLAIAMWVDKRLDARYSDFWHRDQLRLRLRKALGLGLRDVGRPQGGGHADLHARVDHAALGGPHVSRLSGWPRGARPPRDRDSRRARWPLA